MTTWTIVSTDSTTWSVIQNTSQGYFETEDNLDLLVTETGLLFQQEGGVVITSVEMTNSKLTNSQR